MAKSTDPLTLVYDEVWAYLETKSAFTTLVRASNRIKFSGGSRTPQKDKVSTLFTMSADRLSTAKQAEQDRQSAMWGGIGEALSPTGGVSLSL